MIEQFVSQAWPHLLAAAVIYGGMRADLKSMRERAESAHTKIDAHVNFHLTKGV
jgi:hypothetical protein